MGRPAYSQPVVRKNFYLPEDTESRIKVIAEQFEVPEADIFRGAIAGWLHKYMHASDGVRRHMVAQAAAVGK